MKGGLVSMAKCLICGYEARNLQPHLKFKHNLKVHDYYNQYNTTQSDVFDYNNADRFREWEKLHPEEAFKNRSNGGKRSVSKMNKYLKEHPEIKKEIARKGGLAVNGNNLKEWRKNNPEKASEWAARAGHLSSISKGHEYMARVALQNNRYCKYPYVSEKFGINRVFASHWEINFIKLCESVSEVDTLIHEPFGIPYYDENQKLHKYYPDFLVNNSIIVEIKPSGKLNDIDVVNKKTIAEEYCRKNPQYSYMILTEQNLFCIRDGEITTSAQQELLKLLKI